MRHNCTMSLLALLTLGTVVACAKHDASAQAGASQSTSAATQINVCDSNIITVQDVSDIFSDPITGKKSVPGDPGTCAFDTSGDGSLDVTFRPGSGHATVQEYVDGKVPVPTTPLAGVGDRAVWQAALNEVVAEKDNKLCDISVQGSGMRLKDRSPAAMQKKIGALCNKVFAAP